MKIFDYSYDAMVAWWSGICAWRLSRADVVGDEQLQRSIGAFYLSIAFVAATHYVVLRATSMAISGCGYRFKTKMIRITLLVVLVICVPLQLSGQQQSATQISAQVLTRKARPIRTELIYAVKANATIADVYLNYRPRGFDRYRRVRGKLNYQANYYFALDYYPSFEYFFEVQPERGGSIRIPAAGNETIAAEQLPTLEDDHKSVWQAVGWSLLTGIIAAAGVGIVTAKK